LMGAIIGEQNKLELLSKHHRVYKSDLEAIQQNIEEWDGIIQLNQNEIFQPKIWSQNVVNFPLFFKSSPVNEASNNQIVELPKMVDSASHLPTNANTTFTG